MTYQEQLKKYCSDILSGKIMAGIYTKKAVQRFMSDLKRQKEPSFLYEYCPDLADEVMAFAETLQIPDIQRDDGSKNLILLPWQIFVYCQIWGWRHKSDHSVRRFRSGYIEVARKAGKTTGILFPFILWDFLETDSAESYFISADQQQSDKSFKELKYIIKADKDLSKHISETVYAITLNHSRIAFFSAESAAIDGYRNSLSIADEYHQYPSDRIITAFRYGGRARKNCLTLIITSAGHDISGPCYQENLRTKKVLNESFTDETFFGIIWAIDEEDDWKDPSIFMKANPSLHAIIKPEILENDLNDALSMPSHQPEFISKTLGRWTSAKSNWISMQAWQRNADYKIDESMLLGRECYVGIDLSAVNDFTAVTLYFKLDDGLYYPKHHFYIPSATVAEKYRKENINILGWIQGDAPVVTVIDGGTINQEFIFHDLSALSQKYRFREIAYDRYQATHLADKIISALPDVPTFEFPQNIEYFSQPTKDFEKSVLDGKIVDNSPVMLWMLGNVRIKINVNGDYKPMKPYPSSVDRIDGVITSIMALNRLMANENAAPVQEYTTEQMLASF